MIAPDTLFNGLKEKGVELFAGVPDSLLSSFCAYVDDHAKTNEHVITANEGNAVALAAGYHLSTGKLAAVYMQNSGLGNTVNPLSSLTDSEVYKIPLLMVIGWRGEPGVKDEPQHVKQGRITLEQLDLLSVPYWILDADSDLDVILPALFNTLKERNSPVALVVKKGAFSKYKSQKVSTHVATLKREKALEILLEQSSPEDLVVSTTGKTSRELFELRVARKETPNDFLTVGAMGHTSSIALGVALGNPDRRVLCIDGDGSALMHMGNLPIIGSVKPNNLVHILLNNAAHESVGGQPTVAGDVDFDAIAKASGYSCYLQADSEAGIQAGWQKLAEQSGPVLFEIKITTGSRDDLGRPTVTAEQNKLAFMEHACD